MTRKSAGTTATDHRMAPLAVRRDVIRARRRNADAPRGRTSRRHVVNFATSPGGTGRGALSRIRRSRRTTSDSKVLHALQRARCASSASAEAVGHSPSSRAEIASRNASQPMRKSGARCRRLVALCFIGRSLARRAVLDGNMDDLFDTPTVGCRVERPHREHGAATDEGSNR